MSDNDDDFFDNIGGGGGAPSAALSSPGDSVYGEVVDRFQRDYVAYGQEKPQVKEDGKVRKQLVIILQTDLRNWAGVSRIPRVDPKDKDSAEKPPEEDDGKRAVYVPEVAKGLGGNNIAIAIADAVRESKAKFEVGGTLGVKVDKLTDTGKGNPLKEHKAIYKGKAASDGFFDSTPEAPAAEAPAAAPAPNPEPTPAPAAPAPAAQGDPWATSGSTPVDEPPF